MDPVIILLLIAGALYAFQLTKGSDELDKYGHPVKRKKRRDRIF